MALLCINQLLSTAAYESICCSSAFNWIKRSHSFPILYSCPFCVSTQVYVLKRPHVDEFLKRMGELFECVLFTASLSKVRLQFSTHVQYLLVKIWLHNADWMAYFTWTSRLSICPDFMWKVSHVVLKHYELLEAQPHFWVWFIDDITHTPSHIKIYLWYLSGVCIEIVTSNIYFKLC